MHPIGLPLTCWPFIILLFGLNIFWRQLAKLNLRQHWFEASWAFLMLTVVSVLIVRTAMFLNERDLHLKVIAHRRCRAARASRFKNKFLSHVSQEARGPLSAIIGFSGLLESDELPPERAQEFAHIVAHDGELLQLLYGDLLDLSRAEADDLAIASEKVKWCPRAETASVPSGRKWRWAASPW